LGEVLLYQGQLDDALTELRRAAELQPQDNSVHASLAKALAAKGLNQEAQEEMNRAQQAQPRP
jgi:Flp pilus assembly protein TadD